MRRSFIVFQGYGYCLVCLPIVLLTNPAGYDESCYLIITICGTLWEFFNFYQYWTNTNFSWIFSFLNTFNPFTPKSDQCQISPAASPIIVHHTVWRTWLFITHSDERWLHYQFSLPHLYIFSLKGSENVLFELRSERVKNVSIYQD